MSEEFATSLVILDRDGVINEDSDDYIKSVAEWIALPGSLDAIAALTSAGFTIAVATNQSGIARGYFDEFVLAQMHAHMYQLVENAGGNIAALAYCPHAPDAGCQCRKPLPGLLDEIARELELPLQGAWYVGDTEKDIDVALSRQCRPILVLTGKGTLTLPLLSPEKLAATIVAKDLAAAANHILNHSRPKPPHV